MRRILVAQLVATSLLFLLFSSPLFAAPKGKSGQVTFETPEKALAELKLALSTQDTDRLIEIFGKPSEEVFETGDDTADAAALRRLSHRFAQRADLLKVVNPEFEKEEWYKVRYGREGWHMHVPLVSRPDGKGWSFATEYATDADMRARRSMNEVTVVDTLRALVKAQATYYQKDRNGDGVREYAQKFLSLPGRTDGLYWKAEDYGEELSPLDGLVARAMKEGYKASDGKMPSYEGYVYRIIPHRKPFKDRDKYSKKVRFTEDVAFVAYPLTWGSSGDFTFMTSMNGQVWKKDLGFRTERVAQDMEYMKKDHTWIRIDPVLGGKQTRKNW